VVGPVFGTGRVGPDAVNLPARAGTLDSEVSNRPGVFFMNPTKPLGYNPPNAGRVSKVGERSETAGSCGGVGGRGGIIGTRCRPAATLGTRNAF
jgi:hypothetical protein